MAFDRGSITFRICHLPREMPDDALEKFAAAAAAPLDSLKDEPMWGWVSGRHLLERRIDRQTSVLGGHLYLTLRKAERKIPAALLRAECRMAELARLEETEADKIGSKERKTIKEQVTERLLPNMPPQLAGTPFVIDGQDSKLYVGAPSQNKLDIFLDIFSKTVGFEPIPLTPENVAIDLLEKNPDMVPPLNFSPDLPDSSAGGTLGQNFLTWVWFFQEETGGILPPTKLGEFSLMVDGPLVFVADAGEEQGAVESVIKKGTPTISAEAKAALMVGKKLKQAKVILAQSKSEQWTLTLNADEFVFKGMKLPEGEALDRASIFEERVTNLFVFQKVFLALFDKFLMDFSSSGKVQEFQAAAKRWVKDRAGK